MKGMRIDIESKIDCEIWWNSFGKVKGSNPMIKIYYARRNYLQFMSRRERDMMTWIYKAVVD